MPDDTTPTPEPLQSNEEFGLYERRKSPLYRFFVTWSPCLTTFIGGMGLIDTAHFKQWAVAALVVASLSGGSKGPALLNKLNKPTKVGDSNGGNQAEA